MKRTTLWICGNCGSRQRRYLGSYVRAVRERKGLSMKQLAARAGVTFAVISDIECERRVCTPRIAKALGLPKLSGRR